MKKKVISEYKTILRLDVFRQAIMPSNKPAAVIATVYLVTMTKMSFLVRMSAGVGS